MVYHVQKYLLCNTVQWQETKKVGPSFWGQDIIKIGPKLANQTKLSDLCTSLEDISAPQTLINLLFAELEPCCKAGSFA
jgi:hypothetical protein